jgi:hypothetical protein
MVGGIAACACYMPILYVNAAGQARVRGRVGGSALCKQSAAKCACFSHVLLTAP